MELMKDRQAISTEIARLTGFMETNYPELYRYLDENSMTIPSSSHPNVSIAAFWDYLEGLKKLLILHVQSHKIERV